MYGRARGEGPPIKATSITQPDNRRDRGEGEAWGEGKEEEKEIKKKEMENG